MVPTPEPEAAVAPAIAAPVYEEPPVHKEPPVIATAQPAPAPVAIPQPQPIAATPAPLKLEWSSDLQQVETSKARVLAAEQASNDDGAPKRVKRVRPTVESAPNEPLQQVETRN